MRLDKVTQHTDVLNTFNQNSRSGRDWRKGKALTGGDLLIHEMERERSAEAIVIVETSCEKIPQRAHKTMKG